MKAASTRHAEATPSESTRRKRYSSSLWRVFDLVLMALFLLQMGYLYLPLAAHEALGIALFFAALAHTVRRRAWFRSLARGRWPAARVLQALGVVAAFVCMTALATSGVAMSGILPFPGCQLGLMKRISQRRTLRFWRLGSISAHAAQKARRGVGRKTPYGPWCWASGRCGPSTAPALSLG